MSALNLVKGQKMNLTKPDGQELVNVTMGLGWDPVNSGGIFNSFMGGSSGSSIDLDASAVYLDTNKQLVDSIWFGHKRSNDGSAQHSGDNLTGHGDGDDERIVVNLSAVPTNVQTLVFTINSYCGQTFDQVANCFCRLFETGNETTTFCTYKLSEKGSHTAMIMAKLYRHDGKWKIAALGVPCTGQTVQDLMPAIVAAI